LILVIVGTCALATYVQAEWAAGEEDEYFQSCLDIKKETYRDCAAVARRQHVPLFSEPSLDAGVVGQFPYWMWMAVDWRGQTVQGWLRVKSLDDSFQPNDWVWVHQDAVLRANDYRRVTGCWPLKELFTGLGDTTYHYKFGLDGRGVMMIDEKFHERVQVFMGGADESQPVVAFAKGGMWARYDPTRRTLLVDPVSGEVNGESLTSVSQFPSNELRGCGPLPVLERDKPS